MSNAIVSAVRRAFPLALVLSMAVLVTAACTGEDDGDVDDLDGLASTPTTTLPAAPTVATDDTDDTDTDASPTVELGDGGGGMAVTVEDVRTYMQGSTPELNPDDVMAVDFVDGELTVETAWDASGEGDAQSLCEELLMMSADPPITSITINGSDGSSLAECGEGMGMDDAGDSATDDEEGADDSE